MAEPPDLVDDLQVALDAAPPYAVMPVVEAALREAIGALGVTLLLADYAEVALQVFDNERRSATSTSRSVHVEGTEVGRCYRSQELTVEPLGSTWRINAPVSVRCERFGVLTVEVAEEPGDDLLAIVPQVAVVVSYVVASARRYTDVFERVRRRRRLSLAAELQWELLPVLGYDAETFTLAGALEPAYEVGGDNFDYAVDGERLTVSVTDAMGHGLEAALLSTLVVAAMRNCRRAGEGIVEQVTVANQVLCEQFGGDTFATVVIMNIALDTGRGHAVNAGHPQPWRHRRGSAERLALAPDLPLGLFPDSRYHAHPIEVDPGDRLVLLSDGVLEAGPSADESFGAGRFSTHLDADRAVPPREFVRRLIRRVVDHRDDSLRDDATLLCVDWSEGPDNG
ncbi:MAG: serine/threonine-protein phosphatase [Actinobacteria bacterium]|nr:serine/threonine-protein phosphatase [Actinomycetota bacterium]